jgi:hypothetical protein
MVIYNFNIEGVTLVPEEADPPLVINSYTVLSNAFSAKCLEPIGRWHAKVVQGSGIVDHSQFSPCNLLDKLR